MGEGDCQMVRLQQSLLTGILWAVSQIVFFGMLPGTALKKKKKKGQRLAQGLRLAVTLRAALGCVGGTGALVVTLS